MEFREIPAEYGKGSDHPGRVVRFEYDSVSERKYASIYLPCGYDEGRKYDIVYLMHGGGGRPEDFFGDDSHVTRFKKSIDHLIENGEMEPLIIAAPTVYLSKHDKSSKMDSWDAVLEFQEDVDSYLMPAVESSFSTYAPAPDEEGFIASRKHRAFGGFSLGSVTTWYIFLKKMRFFSRFIPMSGDCWVIERKGGRTRPHETAKAMAAAVLDQGYSKDDFRILAATGSEDRAAVGLRTMFEAMEDFPDVFDMSEAGNTSLTAKEGGVHEMKYVKQYLFNLLPEVFKQ